MADVSVSVEGAAELFERLGSVGMIASASTPLRAWLSESVLDAEPFDPTLPVSMEGAIGSLDAANWLAGSMPGRAAGIGAGRASVEGGATSAAGVGVFEGS